MDQPEEELEQIAAWLSEEGLAADSSTEAQLCLLWRALQCARSRLSSVTWDLDTQRSQHLGEMAEVRRSLEQIRIFTGHKDILAQEIQDENDQLKDQLQRLITLQDAQISEVAKMLYQQGLTELIHSSPSEQVAYLLVERASLLETSEDADGPVGDGSRPLRAVAQTLNTNAQQSYHKGAPRHGQSPWKRLFGHKASQSKHTFIPAESRHLGGHASSVERQCSRLERDLEEASRRLAMAHNEIRRLTDELESAHLTQRAYEPELQAAQQEVEQLRQEVDKLKKYEMVELRKAKELNDRLDLEIRALRNRVRALDAEKGSLQQTVVSLQAKVEQQQPEQQSDQDTELAEVVSLQKEAERLESVLQEQQQQAEQQLQTVQVQASESAKSAAAELAQSKQTCRHLQEELTAQTQCLVEKEETAVSLQREVERLESALQEQQQQQQAEQQQLLALQAQANQAKAASQATELIQSNEVSRDLQNKLCAQSRCLLEKDSEIHSLKQQLDNSHKFLDNLIATICTKENNLQDQTDYQEAVKTLLATKDECEVLKKEICETLKCLDKERSKNHEFKEKLKAKLCRTKQKFDDETTWRDERIKHLERELSLCSHSLTKEKELILSITVENDKLLVERRRLLQQLNEEEYNKKDSILTASVSKCRVDFLEMENKKQEHKLLHMSKQLAVLERSLQDMQSLPFAEGLKKISHPTEVFKSLLLQSSSVMIPEPSEIQGLLDNTQSKEPGVTPSPHCFLSGPLSRSAEMGYLNLTSAQSRSDHLTPPAALSSSDSVCS